jgi:UDP-N-acetylglucosamine diphosphorylase/glucosamine-1-phosphate N-acetyltransferase
MYITILAAGIGSRMCSDLPKILHKINHKPMLLMIIEQARYLKPTKIFIVVGKFKDIIEQTLLKYISLDDIEFIIQESPLGTGHAILCTLPKLESNTVNLILNGDTPLLQHTTLKQIYCKFVDNLISNYMELQITAINLNDPTGNGRIVQNYQNKNNIFQKIVEEKDCTDEERNIKLVNCGIYIVTTDVLKKYIPLISNNNNQKEYYLTDLVEIYKTQTNKNVGLCILDDSKYVEISNVNTRQQLLEVEELSKLIN